VTLRVVSFDLDGTLAHPAVFNIVADALGFGEKLAETTRLYFAGKMTAEETFHADYKHFVGRSVAEMRDVLRKSNRWTPGVREAVDMLHGAGVRVVVTTDQPDWLADATREMFGVDDVACTPADVRHGRVAGTYRYEGDKWANLARHLKAWRVAPAEVAHVGNGRNDIPVFRAVGYAIAVNPMDADVRAAAADAIDPLEDARDVARRLLARASR
jgi:HAD superfamily phosphoserine phosphatase-like hydrolase